MVKMYRVAGITKSTIREIDAKKEKVEGLKASGLWWPVGEPRPSAKVAAAPEPVADPEPEKVDEETPPKPVAKNKAAANSSKSK